MPQRKISRNKNLVRKPSTNDPHRKKSKLTNPNNLRYNSSRLANAQSKVSKVNKMYKPKGLYNKPPKKIDRGINSRGIKKRVPLEKQKSTKPGQRYNNRQKAQTTSVNKRNYNNLYLNKQMNRKKRVNILNKKSNLNKAPKIKKSSIVGSRSAFKNSQVKRPVSMYGNKPIKRKVSLKKGKKKETSAPKRFLFKSHKEKEKQAMREAQLKREMRRVSELEKKAKERSNILRMSKKIINKTNPKPVHKKKKFQISKRVKLRPRMQKSPHQRVSQTVPIKKMSKFGLAFKKTTEVPEINKIQERTHMKPKNQSQENFLYLQSLKKTSTPPVNHYVSTKHISIEKAKYIHFGKRRRDLSSQNIEPYNHNEDKELKLALEEVEGTLQNMQSIRRSRLREKTQRSLSKKFKKWIHFKKKKLGSTENPENYVMRTPSPKQINNPEQGSSYSRVNILQAREFNLLVELI